MAIVRELDFGTLSVRVSLVDSERGMLQSAIQEYPLHRKREILNTPLIPRRSHARPRRRHARSAEKDRH